MMRTEGGVPGLRLGCTAKRLPGLAGEIGAAVTPERALLPPGLRRTASRAGALGFPRHVPEPRRGE